MTHDSENSEYKIQFLSNTLQTLLDFYHYTQYLYSPFSEVHEQIILWYVDLDDVA